MQWLVVGLLVISAAGGTADEGVKTKAIVDAVYPDAQSWQKLFPASVTMDGTEYPLLEAQCTSDAVLSIGQNPGGRETVLAAFSLRPLYEGDIRDWERIVTFAVVERREDGLEVQQVLEPIPEFRDCDVEGIQRIEPGYVEVKCTFADISTPREIRKTVALIEFDEAFHAKVVWVQSVASTVGGASVPRCEKQSEYHIDDFDGDGEVELQLFTTEIRETRFERDTKGRFMEVPLFKVTQ